MENKITPKGNLKEITEAVIEDKKFSSLENGFINCKLISAVQPETKYTSETVRAPCGKIYEASIGRKCKAIEAMCCISYREYLNNYLERGK